MSGLSTIREAPDDIAMAGTEDDGVANPREPGEDLHDDFEEAEERPPPPPASTFPTDNLQLSRPPPSAGSDIDGQWVFSQAANNPTTAATAGLRKSTGGSGYMDSVDEWN